MKIRWHKSILIGMISMITTNFSIISPTTAQSVDRPSTKLAQAEDPERKRRLEEQREAERALKEAERVRREIRDNGFRDGNLEQRATDQIIKIRESATDPQKVREAQTEINRIREDNRRNRRYERYPYEYYPYDGDYRYPYNTAPMIPSDGRTNPESPPLYPRVNQNESRRNSPKISVAAGFKDGTIAPALGMRWNNFGVEVGALFNADSLPGTLNDFSLPNNFLFNDLGVKKLSAQYGVDVLGYFDVNPSVSLYGGVGIYFQSKSRIAQSQATNELYQQTSETNVTPAVSGGVDYNLSDSINLGVGYHSIRGITGKIGFSF
jgi:hypothetical protein